MVGARTLAHLAATAFLTVAGVVATPTTTHADESSDPDAVSAALWLATEVDDNGGIPGMVGTPDWGLTIDALIALEATGADAETAQEITAALKSHVRDYNSYDAWGVPGQRIAGATAKLLYAAVITDSDAEAFGSYDLRQETLDLVAGPELGLEEGRVKDKVDAPSVDSSNTFGQSLAVLGLSRSGGVPQSIVDFLIDQQCSVGGFRLYPYAFGGGTVTGDCDEQGADAVLDPDSTSMAVQALYAAAEHDSAGALEAADKGAAWLASIQREDGSFGGSGPTEASNTNSTGLAGQALRAAGETAAADRAAAWVLDHQLTSANAAAASAELGAIAYNGESLAAAQTDGIALFQRDQWRRATPQALLALADVSLGEIGLVDVDPGPVDPQPTPSTPGPGAGGPNGQLPATGAPVLPLAALGIGAAGAGLILLRLSRKESTS
ncbi:prenyltransferase/squalene oxidase repeat-containing protein [Stackebrandtia soli]|uniref:prenyltransferase/squalene oxidase repeat-containing protein n=1 Tax=Stackebrandtia soli TaxID=1892856 RepID=UPI0039EBED71